MVGDIRQSFAQEMPVKRYCKPFCEPHTWSTVEMLFRPHILAHQTDIGIRPPIFLEALIEPDFLLFDHSILRANTSLIFPNLQAVHKRCLTPVRTRRHNGLTEGLRLQNPTIL